LRRRVVRHYGSAAGHGVAVTGGSAGADGGGDGGRLRLTVPMVRPVSVAAKDERVEDEREKVDGLAH
jgi:hypothetical protein